MTATSSSAQLSVKTDFLVTGDRKHLISMHPYRGIPIVSEADFVQLMLKDLAPNIAVKT